MSDKEAGWYPDPDGQNRQRYWDGDSWTEYYTPLPPEQDEVHGATTAVADYPYLAATRPGAADVMLAPSPTTSGGWPGVTAPAAQGGDTLEFSGGGRRSSASRWAMVAATTLVVMLVVGVGWWAFGGGRTSEDPTADPSTSGPAPTDGPTVTADLSVGDSVSGEVPAGGLWVGTLTVGADTTLVLDLRTQTGQGDLRLAVVPEGGGDPVGGNDDRGNYLLGVGGTSLDPLAAVTLEPGTYEVGIDDRDGAATPFDLDVTAVTEPIEIGGTVSGTIPANGAWMGVLVVPSSGDYRIDVQTTTSGADAVLVAIGPDGRDLVSDDRTRDDVNPLLEQSMAEGTWLIVVTEYYHDEAAITVTAAAA